MAVMVFIHVLRMIVDRFEVDAVSQISVGKRPGRPGASIYLALEPLP
jgi:hypothetical protein